MKKSILLFLVATAMSSLNAQNLAGNPGFENDPTTFTVVETQNLVDYNVLRRTNNNFFDAVTQTANPTSDATTITPGMWIKKTINTGNIKFRLSTTEFYSGTTGLHMFINANFNTPTNMTNWYNAVASQKLPNTLDNTSKYRVSVWAKKDATPGNVCSTVTLYITDNTKRTLLSKSINLEGDGTTWTKYENVFDIPAHIVANSNADFSIAYAGVSIKTTQQGEGGITGLTNYSGLYIDDFSVSAEDTTTGLGALSSASELIKAVDGKLITSTNGIIVMYNVNGMEVLNKSVKADEIITVDKGMYIVRLTTRDGSYSTKVVL